MKLVFLLVFALFSFNVFSESYQVDNAHSNVTFKIKHLLSKVEGNFKSFDGNFEFDQAKMEVTNVKFKIDPSSVDTRDQKRDEHLRSADFFNTPKYNEITVQFPPNVKVKENKVVKLKAPVTLLGVTKDVEFKITYLGKVTDPWGNQKSAFEVSSVINRKDFGMTWNKALDKGGFVLGDTVDVSLNIEANLKK